MYQLLLRNVIKTITKRKSNLFFKLKQSDSTTKTNSDTNKKTQQTITILAFP